MDNDIAGTYTKKGEGAVTTAYSGTWERNARVISWNAQLRVGGTLVREPAGSVYGIPAETDAASVVRTEIEACIERWVS